MAIIATLNLSSSSPLSPSNVFTINPTFIILANQWNERLLLRTGKKADIFQKLIAGLQRFGSIRRDPVPGASFGGKLDKRSSNTSVQGTIPCSKVTSELLIPMTRPDIPVGSIL